MTENLRIEIVGTLNKNSSKTEINNRIADLENELNKIRIQATLDDSKFNEFLRKNKEIDLDVDDKELKKLENNFEKISKEFNREINRAIKQLENADVYNKVLKQISKLGAKIPEAGSPYHSELMAAKKDSGFPMRVKKGVSVDSILPEIEKAAGIANLSMEDIVNAVQRGKSKFGYTDIKDDPLIQHLEKQVAEAKRQVQEFKKASNSSDVLGKSQIALTQNIKESNEQLQRQIDLIKQFASSIGKLGNKLPKVNEGLIGSGNTNTKPKQVKQVELPKELGKNYVDAQKMYFDGLDKVFATGKLSPEKYMNFFNAIERLSESSSIKVAKNIENQINKYAKLEQSIVDVIQKQKEHDSTASKSQNKESVREPKTTTRVVGDEGVDVAKYENLQQRIEHIKKIAKDVSDISIKTGKDIDNITQASIKYTDQMGRNITEVYRQVNTGDFFDDGREGDMIANSKWELVEQRATDSLQKRRKETEKLIAKQKELLSSLKLLQAQGKVNSDTFSKMSNAISKTDDIGQLNKLEKSMSVIERNYNRHGKLQEQRKKQEESYNQWWQKSLKERSLKEQQTVKKIEENLAKAKIKMQKQLQDLARTGNYATEELKKIGTGIADSSSLKQLDRFRIRMENMKVGAGFEKEQSKLRDSLANIYTQGKLTEGQFKQLNLAINSTRNIAELNKLQKEIQETKLATENTKSLERLSANLSTLGRTHSKTIDTKAFSDLNKEIEGLNLSINKQQISAVNAANKIKIYEERLNKLKLQAKETARSSLSLGDALQTAMVKFPIWMVASTAFYGTLRTTQKFMSIIVDIDTKMTTLQMVSGATEKELTNTFENATASAEKFSRSLSETMDAIVEFSRQGFKGQDLTTLSDTALIASAVADLPTQQASEYLTSSLVQWNKDTNEAMSIIDSWNELSNNYA